MKSNRHDFRTAVLVLVAGLTAKLVLLNSCHDLGIKPVAPPDTSNPCVAHEDRWQLLGLDGESIASIAVSESDPRIIYAGSEQNFSAGVQGKLFRSTDCGQSWDTVLTGGTCNAILIDPVNSSIVYAAPHGIVKSTDGGATWIQRDNGIPLDGETSVISLALNQYNTNTLFAGTGGFFGGQIYRSVDGGLNWISRSTNDTLKDGIGAIAIDPANSANIYVGVVYTGYIFKSIDNGDTWQATGFRTGGIIYSLEVSPWNPAIIHCGVGLAGSPTIPRLSMSTDGGSNWNAVMTPDSVEGVYDISFSSSDGPYISTERGLYLLEADTTWSRLDDLLRNRPIRTTQIVRNTKVAYVGVLKGFSDGGVYVRQLK